MATARQQQVCDACDDRINPALADVVVDYLLDRLAAANQRIAELERAAEEHRCYE